MLREMLRDHVVAGRAVLPGAITLELMVKATRREHGALLDVRFLQPVTHAPGAPLDLRVDVADGRVQVTDPTRRRIYAEARVGADAPGQPLPDDGPAGPSWGEPLERDRVYEWFASIGLAYGPWFQTLYDIRRRGPLVRARLRAPGGAGFVLHPSILDGALQAIGCVAFGRAGGLFVPAGIAKLTWRGPTGMALDVRARLTSASDDRLDGDAVLVDDAGRAVVALEGVSVRRLAARSDRAAATDASDHLLHACVLVPAPARATGRPPGDWRWLVAGQRPEPHDHDGQVAYVAADTDDAAADFLRWARRTPATRVAVVATSGHPNQEAVLGAARSLRLERPELQVRAVAVARGTPREIVLGELDADEPEVLIDGSARWVPTLQPVEEGGRLALPPQAAVLVTGGYGGLGLTLAEWLFDTFQARLVLVGRRAPAAGAAATTVIENLRGRGAVVVTLAADVADHDAMSTALDQARTVVGPLHAVFHAAGVIRDAALARKSDDDVRAVLRPKLTGTRVLDALTAGDPLACFVLFSSVVSRTGNRGQTDYAAANRFLDAYARQRRLEGRPFQSLAFGPWASVGMAAALEPLGARHGIRFMTPAQALTAIGQALATDRAETVIAPLSPALVAAFGAPPVASSREDESPATVPAASAPAAPMPDDMLDELRQNVARFLEVSADELDVDTDLADFGVDSIMGAQLVAALEGRMGRQLEPTLLFEARTLRALAARLAAGSPPPSPSAAPETAPAPVPAAVIAPALTRDDSTRRDAIAIVGYAARLPGGPDLDAFFAGLMAGRSFIGEIPAERFDVAGFYDPTGTRPGSTRSRWAATLHGIDQFDPLFYGISPREAALIDPQQRLLLDVAWDALDHSGSGPRLGGTRTGVFVAGSPSEYAQRFAARLDLMDGHSAVGNAPSILANRLSHVLDFRGPSLALDTACSSSLVALHLARQSLLSGESTAALVAGVNLLLRPETFVAMSQAQLLSPSGRARPFSPLADGYVRAEGAAAVLLKPLDRAIADGDTIHAVLGGSAVSQDGRTPGLTTPDVFAEAEVIRRALGECDPARVTYVEGHAVGSPLGDRLELDALALVGTTCPVGSVKGNVGHAELVAGLVSLVKVLLAFAKGVVPPVAPDAGAGRYEKCLVAPLPLPADARVLVNAFGFGGTNASVLLERAVPMPPSAAAGGDALLLVSARSEAAFTRTAAGLAAVLDTPDRDLVDVCYTQSTGRRTEVWRAAAVGDRAALRTWLGQTAPVRTARPPRVAFAFTGQGSQFVGMGRELYAGNEVFRAAIERCERLLANQLAVPLRELLFEPDEHGRLNETAVTQPALFALEWALAELWRAAGIEPDVVIGHSVGEIVAATVAGAMTLDEGLAFAVARGRALQATPRGGVMAALRLSADGAAALLAPHHGAVSLAAINGPDAVTIAGTEGGVDAVLRAAVAAGVRGRRLAVSHAFHSPLVEPALDDIERAAARIPARPLRVALLSNLHGTLVGAGERLDAEYWRRQARAPVRFLDGLRALDTDVCLEIGPDAVLTALAAPLGQARPRWLSSLRRGAGDRRSVMEATAGLFVAGAPVDPSVVMPRGRRIALAASVREPRRIWFSDRPEPPPAPLPRATPALADVLRDEVADVLRLDALELDTSVPLRLLGLDSLLAVELAARLEKRLGRSLVIEAMHQDASIDGLVAQAGDRVPSPRETAVESQPGAYADYVRPATMAWLEAGMLDKVYVEARGDRLVALEDGERVEILDAVGGFGCTLFGHNHPALVAHQVACLERGVAQHAQGSQRASAGRLARELSHLLGDGRREFVSTFVNSGAEAVELAVKHAEMEYASRGDARTRTVAKHLARLLHDLGDVVVDRAVCDALALPDGSTLARAVVAIEDHNTGVMARRPVFLAVQRAFHGKTSGAARLTARSTHRTRFSGGLRVEHVAAESTTDVAARAGQHAETFLDLDVVSDRLAVIRHPWSGVAALFIEPVQGEGGVWPLTVPFLEAARRAADDHGFPIAVDEIQTGFGRCGAFSAAHALGLRADYYLFGKALGGGLAKISVLMVDRTRYVADFGLTATSTFAEDDLSASTALAALDVYRRDGIEERVRAAGHRLLHGLDGVRRRYPEVIADVRGLGLLIGVELVDTRRLPSPFLRQLHDEIGRVAASWLTNVARVRTLPTDSAPGTIRLEPSAYVSTADQDRMIAAIERLAHILHGGDVARLVGHLVGFPDDLSQPVRDWRHATGHLDADPQPGDARVAFVTYFTEDRDLVDFCPALSDLPAAARETLVRRIHRLIPPRVVRSTRIQSSGGAAVHIDMIGLVATSGLIEDAFRAGDVEWVREQIDGAIALGAARGATVVGLGGLTSIVTHNGRLAATRHVALTTGNALTVAMGVAAVEAACLAAGVDLATTTAAIVGAAGNIGSSYAESIADRVQRLVLIGRPGSSAALTELAATISARGSSSPAVTVSEDLAALRTADVVIAASNSTRPIIEPEHLRAGPVIICDVAVPTDVSPRVQALRPDVRVVPGGAVRLPLEADLDLVAGHLPPGHVYACMAETMLLGLDGATGHGTFGPVRHDDVVNAAAMAARHGFRLGLADEAAVAGPVPVESDARHGPRPD